MNLGQAAVVQFGFTIWSIFGDNIVHCLIVAPGNMNTAYNNWLNAEQ